MNKNLTAGHVLKEEDLFEVRPCPVDAIPPSIDVVGSQLTVDMEQNSYLKYEHITK